MCSRPYRRGRRVKRAPAPITVTSRLAHRQAVAYRADLARGLPAAVDCSVVPASPHLLGRLIPPLRRPAPLSDPLRSRRRPASKHVVAIARRTAGVLRRRHAAANFPTGLVTASWQDADDRESRMNARRVAPCCRASASALSALRRAALPRPLRCTSAVLHAGSVRARAGVFRRRHLHQLRVHCRHHDRGLSGTDRYADLTPTTQIVI